MRIGSVHIPSPLVLAPMAGVTDLAFRTICRELGAAYTITEMVSAKALCYQDKKTLPLMELGPEEHPGGVQIFGSDLACMEEGAAIIREVAHPDIIDINMGCPVPKVANNGDGSGLLRDLDKACRVAEAVIRGLGEKKGIDTEHMTGVDFKAFKETQYDLLAAGLREHLDMERIYRILEEGV